MKINNKTLKKLRFSELPVEITNEQTTSRSYKSFKDGLSQELKSFYLSPQEKRMRKNTIRVFFKPKDLDFYNLNKKTDHLQNSLNKNSTIQEVFLNKQKSEEIFRNVKAKGNIYVNDLWSEDYYKKVMKFAHLQEIIDDIKENQRKKNILKKNELLKRIQLETLNNFRKAENSDYLMEEFQKNHKPSLGKLKKLAKKPNSDDFLGEKKRCVTEIIQDCDSYTQKYQKECKELVFPQKTQEKANCKKVVETKTQILTNSLINFFELKRKTAGFMEPKRPLLPAVKNVKLM